MDRFVTRINPSISSSSQQAETSSLVQLPQVNVTESSRCETGNTLQSERNKLPLDLDLEKPSQPTLHFPKTKTGSKYRSFQKNWYNGRNWLEIQFLETKPFALHVVNLAKQVTQEDWDLIWCLLKEDSTNGK